MARPLRLFEPGVLYFVTDRTIQGRYLLRPSKKTNNTVGAALARAAATYDVKIYAYVVTSNHVHLILSANHSQAISNFMRDFKSWSATKVGKLIDWTGSFWHRRFSAEPILDDAALRGRYSYILQHGAKEGLVDRPDEWPGLHCIHQLRSGHARTFKWFDETKASCARRKGENLHRSQFETAVTLELADAPFLSGLEQEARDREVSDLIEEASRAATQLRGGAPSLGQKAIEAQDPHTRPETLKRAPRPLCHSSTKEARLEYRAKFRAYVAAFRGAVSSWQQRKYIDFPRYSHSPGALAPTA